MNCSVKIACLACVSALAFSTGAFAQASAGGGVHGAGPGEKLEVLTAVKKWTADFNKGDTKAFLAACAPNAVIVDNFSPFVWQGASACSDWQNANEANDKSLQSTGGVVTLGKTYEVLIAGDRAYAVFAAKFADSEKGKPVTQTSTWTLTLQKSAGAWLFTSSTWGQQTKSK
jgi:ketosteroid isomerase-like protein